MTRLETSELHIYMCCSVAKLIQEINSCQLIIKRLIENEAHTAFIDITASNVINVELKVNDVLIDRRKILNLFLKENIILLEKQSLHEILKKFLEEEKQYAVDYNYFLDECLPIKTLENLANWKPPPTKHVTAPLSKRKKDLNLIKTLICHDMKGGYLEDRFINGAKQDDPFFFVHWAAVDIFGYFSHNLVSIPPCSWISAAHRNGVQVIGTFISEWDEGVKVFETAFSNKILVDQLCMQLVNIAAHYNFDGWLINIENEVEPCQIVLLNHFVKSLTSKMHAYIPGSQVIWYDSVLKNGDLEWQNCLNESNRAFFLNADGIFLDYKWKEKQLIHSYLQAAGRNVDVYVGIDIFGRGDCFTKGGFMTDICLKEIRKHDFIDCRIFAPGWVYECLELKEFKENQFKFWGILQEVIPPRITEGLPYCSSFCPGFGNKMYRNGKIVSNDPWINLNLQQPQPIYYPTAVNCISLYTDDAFNGGGCLCLSGDAIDDKALLEFNILKTSFCLESSCVISYTFKPLTQNTDIALHLDMSSDQGAYKIGLVSTDCKNKEDTNTSVKYLLPATMDDILKAGYKLSPSSEQQTWIREISFINPLGNQTYVLNSIDFRNHTIENISVILSGKILSAKLFTVLFGELEILPVYPVHNLTCEKLICKKSSVKSKTVDIECTLKWQYNSSVFCSDIYIQSTKEAKQYVCTTNQFYYNLKCSVNLTDEIEVILCPKSAGSENLEASLIKIPIKL
ncbi:cytosolic endo-beta-N-acetylglucosaminidase [Caerostris extrusa]|uniref:Cytosolic endo-beta-N-acetylglucosaminidase n=1 Tax=Caerostris extrusa TaxID=172846 RepID=A0AAV4TDL7_CAEEX|nr:cytosolic endo-beta-N-acetylglucosaminidase [Caerostris extrusa]